MSREKLEEHQIWLYAIALALGAGLGLSQPTISGTLEVFISPVLAVMLYGMFSQIPFLRLRKAFSNRRFTAALLTVNFIVVPALVWLLSRFLPDHPPLLLGVYLVLLSLALTTSLCSPTLVGETLSLFLPLRHFCYFLRCFSYHCIYGYLWGRKPLKS